MHLVGCAVLLGLQCGRLVAASDSRAMQGDLVTGTTTATKTTAIMFGEEVQALQDVVGGAGRMVFRGDRGRVTDVSPPPDSNVSVTWYHTGFTINATPALLNVTGEAHQLMVGEEVKVLPGRGKEICLLGRHEKLNDFKDAFDDGDVGRIVALTYGVPPSSRSAIDYDLSGTPSFSIRFRVFPRDANGVILAKVCPPEIATQTSLCKGAKVLHLDEQRLVFNIHPDGGPILKANIYVCETLLPLNSWTDVWLWRSGGSISIDLNNTECLMQRNMDIAEDPNGSTLTVLRSTIKGNLCKTTDGQSNFSTGNMNGCKTALLGEINGLRYDFTSLIWSTSTTTTTSTSTTSRTSTSKTTTSTASTRASITSTSSTTTTFSTSSTTKTTTFTTSTSTTIDWFDVVWRGTGRQTKHRIETWFKNFEFVGKVHHLQLGDEMKVLPDKQIFDSGGKNPVGVGDFGRVVKITEANITVRWYRTGTASQISLVDWASNVWFVGRAYVKVGEELQVLPNRSTDEATAGDQGRVISIASKHVTVKWYTGNRSTFHLDNWFDVCMLSGKVHQIKLYEELQALPGVPGACAGDRGRVTKIGAKDAMFSVVWYSSGGSTEESVGEWFSRLRVSKKAHKLEEGDELEALPVVQGTCSKELGGRAGLFGRVVRVLEGTFSVVMYDVGIPSKSNLTDWPAKYRYTEKTAELKLTSELVALPTTSVENSASSCLDEDENRNDCFKENDEGRIVALTKVEMHVTWYRTGRTSALRRAHWWQFFRLADELRDLMLGNEVAALPLQGFTAPGTNVVFFKAGDEGRITGVERSHGGRYFVYTVTWYRTGRTTRATTDVWARKYRFLRDVPKLTKGVEFEVLPLQDLFSFDKNSCSAVYLSGWTGSITELDSDLDKLCIRWYPSDHNLDPPCGPLAGWMSRFRFIREARDLQLGDEIEVLPGKQNKCSESDGERLERRFEGWLESLAYGAAPRSSPSTQQEQAPQMPTAGGGVPKCKGRIYEVNDGQFCTMWYTGHQNCAGTERWYWHFRYIGKAITSLTNGSVVEVLPQASSGRSPWGEQRLYRRGVVQVTQSELCLLWLGGNDRDQKTCAFSIDWMRSLMYVAENLVKAQGLIRDGSMWTTIMANVSIEEKNILVGDEGAVTFNDGDQFCAKWRRSKCCSCHNLSTLADMSFIVVAEQRSKGDMCREDSNSHVCQSTKHNEDGQASASLLWVIGGTVALVLAMVTMVWFMRRTATKKALITDHDSTSEVEIPWISFNPVEREAASGQKRLREAAKVYKRMQPSAFITFGTRLKFSFRDHSSSAAPGGGSIELADLSGAAAKVGDDEYCDAEMQRPPTERSSQTSLVSKLAPSGTAVGSGPTESEPLTSNVRRRGASRTSSLLTSAEPSFHVTLAEGPEEEAEIPAGGTSSVAALVSQKFASDVPKLKTGHASTAAEDLLSYLSMSIATITLMYQSPLKALRQEWEDHLGKQPTDERNKGQKLLVYILDERAFVFEETSNDGHSIVLRDVGHEGMTLEDFAREPTAVRANLSIAQVASLRIYTSSLFKYINPPFRADENLDKFQDPHPVGITVMLIAEGLKRMRSLHAPKESVSEMFQAEASAAVAMEANFFWRGMQNIKLPSGFKNAGGTELQCMSTTEDVNIAGQYGNSQHPLLFCIKADSFMRRGADISWLSLYPHEKEILYPPLTYLKYLGQRKILNSPGIVVYVEPIMGG